MGVKQVVCSLSVLLLLAAGGTAFAQRHPPATRGHAMAVPRQHARQPRVATPRGRAGQAVIRPYQRFYGRDFDRHSGAVRFGLYLGYPYAYSYYGYPYYHLYPYAYGYPYSYSYFYPYAYSYPYAYPYAYPYPSYAAPYGGAADVTPPPQPLPGQQPPAAAQPAPVERGLLAIEGAPDKATIYVDGNYAGYATDFAAPHPLSEVAGYHRIEIEAPGQRPVVVHVDIQPGRTLTYHYPATGSTH